MARTPLANRSSRRDARTRGDRLVQGLILAAVLLASASGRAASRAEEPGVVTGVLGGLAVAGAVAGATALPIGIHDPPPGGFAPGSAIPGRLVVKYRSDLDECIPCLLDGRRASAPTPVTRSLDELHARLGVRSARPLFAEGGRVSASRARADFRVRLAEVADRFPARSARGRGAAAAPDLSAIHVLELATDRDPEQAAAEYAADPAVEWAEPDRLVAVGLSTNDPYLSTSGAWSQSFGDLWGLHAIDALDAWDVATGDGVVVAVIDTGIDPSHPDLAANLWTNPGEIPGNALDDDGNGFVDDVAGWDFAEGDAVPSDRHGHGTHVAGTVAAVGDNAEGIVGVAWNARVMAVKGLGDDGFGAISHLVAAILYAAENGADVINNSWGGLSASVALYEAMEAADALGTVVVSSAGNEGLPLTSRMFLPAGHPRGLTVGALDPFLGLAGFSNRGPLLSLTAPGVDVLSLRSAKEVFAASLNVGQRYVRLSGTSMASPHAAGAAAVLLQALPSLTTAEVRWHLELNADQPGAPGYEGERFNPAFGYGRLDLASAFAAPPVTTRLALPGIREWHGFAGTAAAAPGNPASFLFTSATPVAWSVAAPPWLDPAASSGAGDGEIALTIDATGLAVGSHAGDVELSAPLAADGGGAFATRVHVHDDTRLGAPVTLSSDGFGTSIGYTPAAVGNGVSAAVAWQTRFTHSLAYALVDGSGAAGVPVEASLRPTTLDVSLATDGHDYLLAWVDLHGGFETIRFTRIAASGEMLDTGIVGTVTRRDKPCEFYDLAGVGFDGERYWLGFVDRKLCRDQSELFVVPVRRDGSFGKKQRIAKLKTRIFSRFACASGGGCLFAWLDSTPESIDAFGKFIRGGWAMPVVGGAAAGPPQRVVGDIWVFTSLASNGTDYLALGQRLHLCGPAQLCRAEAISVPISASGAPLSAEATVVSNVPPGDLLFPWPGQVAWRGDAWIATLGIEAVDDSPFEDGGYVFVSRLDASGASLSTEFVGDLVDAAGRGFESVVATTATHTVVAWEDANGEPLEDEPAFPHPRLTRNVAQRVLPTEPGADYPDRALGTIGTLSVAEGARISFRATAPSLAPDAAFGAANLPPGAVFDPATRLFQWRPSGAQAGTHAGIEISADDGSGTAGETFSIAVQPSIASLSGRVRLADGSGVAHAVLELRGGTDRSRTIVADDDGRFLLEGGLRPGRVATVRIAQATRKQYRMTPGSFRVLATTGDQVVPDFVATPR